MPKTKLRPVLPALLTTVLLSACATPKSWTAIGGSRADGVVRLSIEEGEMEKATYSEEQGRQLAAQRCRSWGYDSAEAFGGTTSQCVRYGGVIVPCSLTRYTREYQCTSNAANRNPQQNQPDSVQELRPVN